MIFLQGSFWIKSIHTVFFSVRMNLLYFLFNDCNFWDFFVLEIVFLDSPWKNLFLTDFLLNKNEVYGLPINLQRFFEDAHTTSKQNSATKTLLRRTYQQNVSMNVSPEKIEKWDFSRMITIFIASRSLTKNSIGYLWMKLVGMSSR